MMIGRMFLSLIYSYLLAFLLCDILLIHQVHSSWLDKIYKPFTNHHNVLPSIDISKPIDTESKLIDADSKHIDAIESIDGESKPIDKESKPIDTEPIDADSKFIDTELSLIHI